MANHSSEIRTGPTDSISSIGNRSLARFGHMTKIRLLKTSLEPWELAQNWWTHWTSLVLMVGRFFFFLSKNTRCWGRRYHGCSCRNGERWVTGGYIGYLQRLEEKMMADASVGATTVVGRTAWRASPDEGACGAWTMMVSSNIWDWWCLDDCQWNATIGFGTQVLTFEVGGSIFLVKRLEAAKFAPMWMNDNEGSWVLGSIVGHLDWAKMYLFYFIFLYV